MHLAVANDDGMRLIGEEKLQPIYEYIYIYVYIYIYIYICICNICIGDIRDICTYAEYTNLYIQDRPQSVTKSGLLYKYICICIYVYV